MFTKKKMISGSEEMWLGDFASKVSKMMKDEKDDSVYISSIRIIAEMCKTNVARAKKIITQLGMPWFLDLLNSNNQERVNVAQYCLQVL